MIMLPSNESESARLGMLRSLGLLDRDRAPQHDEIAALAAEIAGAPWALVTLVDSERNWYSGSANYPHAEGCRWSSFCTHVIAEPDKVLWVEDASKDFRFSRNRQVMGAPRLRFYAGAPIVVNGHAVGAVCVFDKETRKLDTALVRALSRLSKIVAQDLAARHHAQSRQTALLASADALIDCDDHGTITQWSEGAETLFGFSAAEAVGEKIEIIVPAEHKESHNRGLERWRRGGRARLGRRLELEACRKDGSAIDIELWMSVAYEQGVPHIHANIRDISERKARAAALLLETARAEAANVAKTAFLTNMGHELRTPLNGIVAVADLLATTDQSEYQRELTSIVSASSHQLGKLIGDILDLARMESGDLVMVDEPIAMADIVENVLCHSTRAANERGVEVFAKIAPDVAARVMCDPLRLKQVLNNLMSNAIKFTERGSVSLHVSREGNRHRFEVRDTGVGFDDTQREILFGRFQQADGTYGRRFGGSGMGLAIARELVVAMGGDMDCRSEPGKGATFWLTLPLKPVGATPLAAEQESDRALGLGRALVVDDNATNRRVSELILQAAGFEVDCVQDGQQAVEAYVTNQYDVVLMDMMMPVMDGLAATVAIRKIERIRGETGVPIIMLTANTLPQHVKASLEAGADLHLPKPVGATALMEALATVQHTSEASESSNAHRAA